jgi:hypothetical protein
VTTVSEHVLEPADDPAEAAAQPVHPTVSSQPPRRTWASHRGWILWLTAASAVTTAIRLPMVSSPLGPDEGGYLSVARGWATGATLYRDVWVDRPQGLLVLFRAWDWLSGGGASSVRVMAILFGIVLVVATGIAVRAIAGEIAGRCAAMLCAVVTSTPVLEGYAANGELLSGAIAASAIAAAAVGARGAHRLRWWVVVGILAGIAISLKQSGFDGLLVVGVWLLLTLAGDRARRRLMWRRLLATAAGVLIPIGALLVHAAATGWARWWWAVIAYRLHTQSAMASGDWGNLERTAPVVTTALGLVVAAALCGAVVTVVDLRRAGRPSRGAAMLLVWPLVALLAIVLGGGFWRHYWVQLGAPASALAGIALARTRRIAPLVLAVLIGPTLAVTGWVFAAPRATWMVRAAGDWRAPLNLQVAQWFRANGQPHPSLYVMCASAGLYAQADAIPHYPYLWFVEVHHGPNALPLLVHYLHDPIGGPEFIAQYQGPDQCDQTGRVAAIVRDDFHAIAYVANVTILQRDAASAVPVAIPPGA